MNHHNHKKPQKNIKEGTFTVNQRRFGFLTTDDQEEFFIPPALAKRAIPGDRISCNIVQSQHKPGEFQAKDLRVTRREPTVWLGTIKEENGRQLLTPDAPCFLDIEVTNLTQVPSDYVVAVRVEVGDLSANYVQAKVERVLGPRNRPGFDQDYATALCDFPPYFSRRAHEEAAEISDTLTEEDLKGRRDLRQVAFVTIDGDSTLDFDDAVYGENKADGGTRILVAIADVSHYVRVGSALYTDAVNRATSVYLPGKTLPMLPEKISNGVCSLVPNQDRLVVVAEVHLDAAGAMVSTDFYRAVIRSAAQLTYSRVQAWMDSNGSDAGLAVSVDTSLLALRKAYGFLKQAHDARGKMEFEDGDKKLHLRADGGFDISFEARTESHMLVEELMLLANQAVAKHMQGQAWHGLYRYQPAPEKEDWELLKQWAADHGLALTSEEPSMQAVNRLMVDADAAGLGLKASLAVRSVMQPAVYSHEQSSHFSLGYEAYTHFTSPIRRLADLVVHRILLGEFSPESLLVLVERCSSRSRGSRKAERYVWDRLTKRTLARDVSKNAPLKAHVVHSSKRALRVALPQHQTSALIEDKVLEANGCSFDAKKGVWVNGTVWETGHELSVNWIRLEDDNGRTELYAVPADSAQS